MFRVLLVQEGAFEVSIWKLLMIYWSNDLMKRHDLAADAFDLLYKRPILAAGAFFWIPGFQNPAGALSFGIQSVKP